MVFGIFLVEVIVPRKAEVYEPDAGGPAWLPKNDIAWLDAPVQQTWRVGLRKRLQDRSAHMQGFEQAQGACLQPLGKGDARDVLADPKVAHSRVACPGHSVSMQGGNGLGDEEVAPKPRPVLGRQAESRQ